MKNFYQQGDVMDYTAGADLSAGDVVVLSGIGCGIAANDIANGAVGPVNLKGVYKVAKQSSHAIAQGARVYWNASGPYATSTASTHTLMGVAMKAAGSSDAYVYVLLVLMGDTDPGQLTQAAVVNYSAGSNLVGVDGTGSNAAPLAGTETRLDDLDTAVAAILTSLKAAGLMASA